MKKSTVIPSLLAIYLTVMASIGYHRMIDGQLTPLYYFGLIAATVAVICSLRRNLLKREKRRIHHH